MAKRALAAATALLAVFTALLAYYYVYTGLWAQKPAVVVALAAACLVLGAAARWAPPPVARALVYGLFLVAAVEAQLQVLAYFHKLPFVATYDFAPYARVYTDTGNSVTNRWGWYAPRFELAPGRRRVALIGDSYLHAPDIQPEQHMAVKLQALLRADGRDVEVYPLGISGTGPAYYLELLKYSKERLNVDEAVIFVTVINDYMNSSYELMNPWWDHSRYLYYTLADDGSVRFDERSAPALERLRREWDLNHAPLFLSLARTLRSHFLLEKAAKQVLDRFRQGRPAAPGPVPDGVDIPLGGDRGLFETPRTQPVRRSIAIGNGVLRLCHEYAKANGIALRLVAIPAVPLKFYEVYGDGDRTDWRLKFGRYDFDALETLVLDFAKSEGLPALGLGRRLREKKLTARQVRPLLYLGFGHFSPEGQVFVAEALRDAFWPRPKP